MDIKVALMSKKIDDFDPTFIFDKDVLTDDKSAGRRKLESGEHSRPDKSGTTH